MSEYWSTSRTRFTRSGRSGWFYHLPRGFCFRETGFCFTETRLWQKEVFWFVIGIPWWFLEWSWNSGDIRRILGSLSEFWKLLRCFFSSDPNAGWFTTTMSHGWLKVTHHYIIPCHCTVVHYDMYMSGDMLVLHLIVRYVDHITLRLVCLID